VRCVAGTNSEVALPHGADWVAAADDLWAGWRVWVWQAFAVVVQPVKAGDAGEWLWCWAGDPDVGMHRDCERSVMRQEQGDAGDFVGDGAISQPLTGRAGNAGD
jgi:hypothetical protein